VRVGATGIYPGEVSIREGRLEHLFPVTFPSGQGSDLAGVVEEIGAGVEGFTVGEAVMGWTGDRAAHAELVSVPAAQLTPSPPRHRGRPQDRFS
jgi:NADPH:quinone reductase-like Zn-dependent oxidoreductase